MPLLHIKAGKENERGPLYMESALAAMHDLKGRNSRCNLEIGQLKNGKIAFFVRGTQPALRLAESQIYAQYPDCEIETAEKDPFELKEGQSAISCSLILKEPEVFPIKRHPQFDDLLGRVNVSPIAGISSAIAQTDDPDLQVHLIISVKPVNGSYRRRALRFLPLLGKGLANVFDWYGRLFTRLQLARGRKRIICFLPAALMGGFKAWPFFKSSNIKTAGSDSQVISDDPEEQVRIMAGARNHDREDRLTGAQDKVNRLLFESSITISISYTAGKENLARQKLTEISGSFRQFSLPQSNGFKVVRCHTSTGLSMTQKKLSMTGQHSFILSVEELATIWHFPTILVQTPAIDFVPYKKLEPPVNLPAKTGEKDQVDLTVLGEAVYRGRRRLFGIKDDDRRRHTYIVGKTGMGKSTLLENMIFSDIERGAGVGVIDPHGDLIDNLLKMIPRRRINDVLLFEPADKDYCLSFNMLECKNPHQRNLISSGLMGVFTRLWPDVWSGRMEHILRNTLLALLENEGTSMLGILRMFADKSYRGQIVAKVTDPLVKSFWLDEFAGWSEQYRTEAVSAIQNKIGQLLTAPLIRNIVGQVRCAVDLRHAMDTGKIVLVNLSKGKIGEDVSAFLGTMLITKFQIDAMSRSGIPESERRDFYLYVDEFQNFVTKSFASILSEARKYRLSLTMANQYISQLMINGNDTTLKDAVFGNVGSLLSFQVGSDDAEALSLQFEEAVTANDILSLPKYHAYCRLMIDGMPGKPFSMATLPSPEADQDTGRIDVIRKLSRERYSLKKTEVEEKIMRWAGSAQKNKEADKDRLKQKEKDEEDKKRAKEKDMKLDEFRLWRDREEWINDFNILRRKEITDGSLNQDDRKLFADLEKKLKDSGGVPPLSKALQRLKKKV